MSQYQLSTGPGKVSHLRLVPAEQELSSTPASLPSSYGDPDWQARGWGGREVGPSSGMKTKKEIPVLMALPSSQAARTQLGRSGLTSTQV